MIGKLEILPFYACRCYPLCLTFNLVLFCLFSFRTFQILIAGRLTNLNEVYNEVNETSPILGSEPVKGNKTAHLL